MGMVMELFAVRDATLGRLLADPPLVWQLVAPDDPEMYARARAETRGRGPGFLARLFGARATQGAADDATPLALADDEGSVADLDKSWHGIHFLLTGTDEAGDPPLDFLAVGGTDIGTADVGYGPARGLAPALVAVIALELARLSDDALCARFDPAVMSAKGIYPDIWGRDPADDDSLGYLRENLVGLRGAVMTAASRGQGLVIVLQ